MKPAKFLRGMFLFGGVFRLFAYFYYFRMLNQVLGRGNIDSDKDRFLVEQIYAKFLRNKEKLFYGKSFTLTQRNAIKKLVSSTDEFIVDGLILGRCISKNGSLEIKPWKVYASVCFTVITMIVILLLLAAFGILVFLSKAAVLTKIFAMIVISLPFIWICYISGTLSFYPFYCARKVKII